VKLVSDSRVAFENKGLAWAENRAAIQALIRAQDSDEITASILKEAKVGALLTDSACDVTLAFSPADNIAPDQVFDYETDGGSFTITRWRVAP
jgi:hypothetical protein